MLTVVLVVATVVSERVRRGTDVRETDGVGGGLVAVRDYYELQLSTLLASRYTQHCTVTCLVKCIAG